MEQTGQETSQPRPGSRAQSAGEPEPHRTGRVVFVTQHYPPEQGGAASRIHDTARNLAADGWDVAVLAPPPCYPFTAYDRSWRRYRHDEVDGVAVHRLWTWQPGHRDPGVISRLPYFLLFALHAACWLLVHREEYDVVTTTTPPVFTGLAGLVGSLFAPWTVDVRDLWIDNAVDLGYIVEGGVAERIARTIQRTVLTRADRLSVTTPSLGRAVAERYGPGMEAKTVVVPNGVDIERFHPSPADGEAVDGEEVGQVRRDPVLVYAGSLGRAQDLEPVVEAMALVEHDVTLRLVGSGDAEDDLRALVVDLGLEDRVEFVGLVPREEIPAILARAQVAVAPIRATEELAYAMPTKVYEYLACGLPTVVTGRGEIEAFATETGGAVHVENDPARLAAVVDELLGDERRQREMGRRGRAAVVADYDRGAIAERLSDTLASLVAAQA